MLKGYVSNASTKQLRKINIQNKSIMIKIVNIDKEASEAQIIDKIISDNPNTMTDLFLEEYTFYRKGDLLIQEYVSEHIENIEWSIADSYIGQSNRLVVTLTC